MQEVAVADKRLSPYRTIIGEAALSEILGLGDKLRGKSVAHVSATPYGGGVAELLQSVVPLQRDAGLDVHWYVLSGSDPFFAVTKAMHNGLQGGKVEITPEMVSTYRRTNEANASEFEDDFDFVVIHDPQPAPFVSMCERRGVWVWRCHIDLTDPNPSALAAIAPYIQAYDACIFTAESYVPPSIHFRKTIAAPPAIDPLSTKNRDVSSEEQDRVLSQFDVDTDRPVINQVGRFDPWKDPLGVIDAYRIVKSEIPGVQLLMIGSMAKDDPEGWRWFEQTARHAGDDPDIHFLTDLVGVGPLEVNVFQRESDVAIAKSLREGFGLIVSESLWKGVPVVGGNVTGIALQVENGRHGFLVSSVTEAAERTVQLLRDENSRNAMGKAGRERVRTHFLITRYVRDYLRLFAETSRGV